MILAEVSQPRVITDPAAVARGCIGNILRNRRTGNTHTITACTSLTWSGKGWSAMLELDGWIELSLSDLTKQFEKIGHVDLKVTERISTGYTDSRIRLPVMRAA